MTQTLHDKPIRTCVGCGESAAQREMLRLRLDVDGELRIVARRSIAGRTGYVHAREDCVRALERSKRLHRSLRQPVDTAARKRFVEVALLALVGERAELQGLTVG
jgi:predicted RNA-binding protein YlxR (DUF448 family)